MNSMQLKDKLKNIAKKKNIDFNTIFRLYMYDRFIERLSISKYKDCFIIKGGFYLSTLYGIENRSTIWFIQKIGTILMLIYLKMQLIKLFLKEII